MRKLEGSDYSIEISLQEHGLAWSIGKTETIFYYGVGCDRGIYTLFDWVIFPNDIDIFQEYDWADFELVSQYVGLDEEEWEEMELVGKIEDLSSYYGFENVFGFPCTGGMTYEEVIEGE